MGRNCFRFFANPKLNKQLLTVELRGNNMYHKLQQLEVMAYRIGPDLDRESSSGSPISAMEISKIVLIEGLASTRRIKC